MTQAKYLPKKIKVYTFTNLHMNIHKTTFVIAKIENNQMSISRWMGNRLPWINTLKYFSAITEWNVDVCHGIDESQSNYLEWKNQDKKRERERERESVNIAWFHLCKVLENEIILSLHINGCFGGEGWEGQNRITEEYKETLRLINMFIILIAATVSNVLKFVRWYPLYMYILMCIHCASIKL